MKFIPAILIFCFTAVAAAAPAELSVNQNSYSLVINVQLWTEDSQISGADLTEAAVRWRQIANAAWNHLTPHYHGKAVSFDFRVSAVPGKTALDREHHQVEIIYGAPNSIGMYSAYVVHDDDPRVSHEGVFPIQIKDPTLAHEFGHLMGLSDEYDYFYHREDIKPSLDVNDEHLTPGHIELLQNVNVWFVGYSLAGDAPGIMSQANLEIKPYYIERILRYFQSNGRVRP